MYITTLYWMELEQLSYVSGSSKPWFNRSPFTLTGMALGFHRSGSKCSCQREVLGDQGMLSLDKSSISAKYRSIINTTYKKRKGYIMREDNHHRLSKTQMVSLPCTFLSQQNQARSQLVKNWQISISLWVINSEKSAVSKPVLCIVLVSVGVAINNRNWKYLGWLQHPFLSFAIQRCVPTQIFLEHFTHIRAYIWQAEIFKTSLIYLLSLHRWYYTKIVLCCPPITIRQILNGGVFTCWIEQLIQNGWCKY